MPNSSALAGADESITYSWSAWFAVTIGVVSRISAIETEAYREDGTKYNRNR